MSCAEVVVSDNASTDIRHDRLDEYRDDDRVRIFINESNIGICQNHNLVIERSRGAYIVLLSAADVLFPRHVERLMRRMQDPSDPVSIASGHGLILDEQLQAQRSLNIQGKLPLAYSRRDDFGGLLFDMDWSSCAASM